jgi:hypothetical protein
MYNVMNNFKTIDELQQFKDSISMIKKFISTPVFISLKKSNYNQYVKELETIFPIFAENYNSLFTILISGENVEMLDVMLDSIADIAAGKISKDEAEKELGDVLASKYMHKK